MRHRAKRRDACERDIIKALRAVGATVSQLDGEAGLPDLLVGWRGHMLLMECKDPDDGARNSRTSGAKVNNRLGLRDSQWAWWQAWTGPSVLLVTTPAQAIAGIYAMSAP